MKLKTNQGDEFLIDDEDYDLIKDHGWTTLTRKYTRKDGTKHITKRVKSYINGKTNYLHRVLLDAPKGMEIDHINGNPMDNRRSNLRVCTPSQNQHNRRLKTIGSSKYKGVCWHKQRNKWMACIRKDHKQHYLGLFETEREAALAYDKASKELHGEYGWTNEDLGLL